MLKTNDSNAENSKPKDKEKPKKVPTVLIDLQLFAGANLHPVE